MEFIGGGAFVPNYADNVLNTAAALEKWMGGGRYDQGLDLGEFDALKRALKWGRGVGVIR